MVKLRVKLSLDNKASQDIGARERGILLLIFGFFASAVNIWKR